MGGGKSVSTSEGTRGCTCQSGARGAARLSKEFGEGSGSVPKPALRAPHFETNTATFLFFLAISHACFDERGGE